MRYLLLAVIFSAGCVQTLQPLVPDDKAETSDQICGVWKSPDGRSSLSITRTPIWPPTYSVVMESKDDDSKDRYWLRLTTFHDKQYFQVASAETAPPLTVSCYKFGRYSVNRDHLIISLPGGSKLPGVLRQMNVSYVDRRGYHV